MVKHHFSFNTIVDSPDAEVLDYQYGSSGQFGTHANKERVQLGQVFPQWNTAGVMPKGEFLYVKWRLKTSGQVYEDKVNLTIRLPAEITDCGIHFVIKGPQLYVYLIPPPGNWPAGAMKESAAAYLKQHQIYPDQAMMLDKEERVDRTQARRFMFAGQRRQAPAWASGAYSDQVTLIRALDWQVMENSINRTVVVQ